MKPKYKRMRLIALCLLVMGAGLAGILYAFNDSLVFFYTPTQLAEKKQQGTFNPTRALRIGGLVKQGSVKSLPTSGVSFAVTDLNADIPVVYRGLMPSLFREGQGVVAQGMLDDAGVLQAEQILAKHDENYMPREVMDALKASGQWREDGGYKKRGTP